MIEHMFEQVADSRVSLPAPPRPHAGGESRWRVSHSDGMQVVEVIDLGHEAIIVEMLPRPILLIDAGLTCDERMVVMNRVMDELAV